MSRYIDALEVNEVLGKAYNECAESALMPENKTQGLIAIGINYARNLIMDKVSAADVKPIVSGEWELFEEWNFNGGIRECYCAGYRCSICKEEPSEYHFFDNPDYPPKFNFCPHCGADMRGEEND